MVSEVGSCAGAGALHTSPSNPRLSFAGTFGEGREDAPNESQRSPECDLELEEDGCIDCDGNADGGGDVAGFASSALDPSNNEGVDTTGSALVSESDVGIGSGVDQTSFSWLSVSVLMLMSGSASGDGMGSGVDHALSAANRSPLYSIFVSTPSMHNGICHTHNRVTTLLLRTAHIDTATRGRLKCAEGIGCQLRWSWYIIQIGRYISKWTTA